jgi:hypothetical protein
MCALHTDASTPAASGALKQQVALSSTPDSQAHAGVWVAGLESARCVQLLITPATRCRKQTPRNQALLIRFTWKCYLVLCADAVLLPVRDGSGACWRLELLTCDSTEQRVEVRGAVHVGQLVGLQLAAD